MKNYKRTVLRVYLKFIHEVHSLRVVDKLCNGGKGLNLTYGVRDGIINHNGEDLQQSLKPSSIQNKLNEIHDRKSVSTSFESNRPLALI